MNFDEKSNSEKIFLIYFLYSLFLRYFSNGFIIILFLNLLLLLYFFLFFFIIFYFISFIITIIFYLFYFFKFIFFLLFIFCYIYFLFLLFFFQKGNGVGGGETNVSKYINNIFSKNTTTLIWSSLVSKL